MREDDTQTQTELVFDSYSDSLEDIIDSDIDDGIPEKNNPLQLSNSSALALRLEKALLLL